MKWISTIILIAGIVFGASCNNSSNTNPNLLVTPAQDSVSKGSYLQISFPSGTGDTESFNINDLILNNQVVISMSATTALMQPDSLFATTILVTDHKSQKISLNLSVTDTNKLEEIGNYYVVTNNSTFTDYSKGANKNYAVSIGSHVKITHDGPDCITGQVYLNLYYNHVISQATGNFKIFH